MSLHNEVSPPQPMTRQSETTDRNEWVSIGRDLLCLIGWVVIVLGLMLAAIRVYAIRGIAIAGVAVILGLVAAIHLMYTIHTVSVLDVVIIARWDVCI